MNRALRVVNVQRINLCRFVDPQIEIHRGDKVPVPHEWRGQDSFDCRPWRLERDCRSGHVCNIKRKTFQWSVKESYAVRIIIHSRIEAAFTLLCDRIEVLDIGIRQLRQR